MTGNIRTYAIENTLRAINDTIDNRLAHYQNLSTVHISIIRYRKEHGLLYEEEEDIVREYNDAIDAIKRIRDIVLAIDIDPV